MNLSSRGVRRTLAFACSTVVVAAGASFFAVAPASAVGTTIGFYPSTTTATILNVDPTLAKDAGAPVANAALAYGLKLTGNTDTVAPLAVYSDGPGQLFVQRVKASTVTPAANPTAVAAEDSDATDPITGTVVSGTPTVITTDNDAVYAGGNVDVDDYIKIGTGVDAEWARITAVGAGAANATVTVDRPLTARAGQALATVADAAVTDALPIFLTVADETTAWVPDYVNGDTLFLGATVAGSYTVKFGKDINQDKALTAADDDITGSFTLVAKNIYPTADDDYTVAGTDFDMAVSGNTVDVGLPITFTGSPAVTLSDARGQYPSTTVPALGKNLGLATKYAYTNGAALNNGAGAAPTFGGTSFTQETGDTTIVDTVTLTPKLLFTKTPSGLGTYTGGLATSTPSNNTVTGTTLAVASGQSTNVTSGGVIRPGTQSVTYSATATKAAGATVVPGATVWFTITANAGNIDALTDLTVTGKTIVANAGSTTVGKVSAVTGDDGVASITVNSTQTANLDGYTVRALSGAAVAGAGNLVTALYTTPAATLTPGSDVAATVGSTVTLTGTVTDQWSQIYRPATGVQATVTVLNGGAVRTTKTVDLVDGAFSANIADVSPSVGVHAESYKWALTSAPGTFSATKNIAWQTSVTTGSVTMTAPLSTATPTLEVATAPLANGVEVTGSLLDASSAGLAYQGLTLTGSDGVYFSTVAAPGVSSADDLKSTLTTTAGSTGVYQVWAFFTKAGKATVTATSGTVSKSVDVVVSDSIDPYQVIAIDSAVELGKVGVITGRVKDAFGNPVKNNWVSLSLGASTLGTLGAGEVRTNADGIWSTSFTAGSTAGDATLTATLCNTGGASCTSKTANPTPSSTWLSSGGLTVPTGEYLDQATLAVAKAQATTISAPTSRLGAGNVTLTGNAVPGVVVEIYSRAAGGSTAFGWIDSVMASESDGSWSSVVYLSAPTTFIAKTSTSTSSTVTVGIAGTHVPVTAVTFTIKPVSKGVVMFSVNGSPNVTGTITLYQNSVKVKSWTSNAWGDGGLKVRTSLGKKNFRVVFSPSGYVASGKIMIYTIR